GTEGGITTGAPVVVRAAMKPISTLLMGRDSVNLATGENERTVYERSDFTAVPRACVVGEAMVAFVLADALLEKLGGDNLPEIQARLVLLREQEAEWRRSGVRSDPYEWQVP
ncbi:MAG TPA: chorismate synthase, partial [Chloroflexi bacterium]|nr:chorismate synthase [Chloroflexota bacterium]